MSNKLKVRRSSAPWWFALFIAIFGGTITYAMYLDKVNPSSRILMAASGSLTIVGTGICIICATASWWFRR